MTERPGCSASSQSLSPGSDAPPAARCSDASGRPVQSATVSANGPRGEVTAVSDTEGRFELDYSGIQPVRSLSTPPPVSWNPTLTISAPTAAKEIDLVLHPSSVNQQITVTATRSSIDLPATANTIYALTTRPQRLPRHRARRQAPPAGRLRALPPLQLARAEPHQPGHLPARPRFHRRQPHPRAPGQRPHERCLRRMDPLGRDPRRGRRAVTIATGGGSDLYGSSALGGVIDVVPARPSTALVDLSALGGGQDILLARPPRRCAGGYGTQWRQLLAADSFRTAGYIPTAPSARRPGRRAPPTSTIRPCVRNRPELRPGSKDANPRLPHRQHAERSPRQRHSPPDQRDPPVALHRRRRLESAGAQASGRVRLFGSDEGYRQSFSSINAARTSEILTRLQHVRTQELGASSDAAFALSPIAIVAASMCATSAPPTTRHPSPPAHPAASQTPPPASASSAASAKPSPPATPVSFREHLRRALAPPRLRFQSRHADHHQPSSLPPPPATRPNRSEFIASPRLGIVRQIASDRSLHASVFRAFRTPTMNELYRTGQVGAGDHPGQLAAPVRTRHRLGDRRNLRIAPQRLAALRHLLLDRDQPPRLRRPDLEHRNLHPRQAREPRPDPQPGHRTPPRPRPAQALSATLGYQYAHAVVTRFSAQPSLVGNWIPEVPRQSFTAQLRAERPRLGELTLAARASGHAWDDSANTYAPHSFFSARPLRPPRLRPHWTASLILTTSSTSAPMWRALPSSP
jgi:hypothetical protein